MTRGAYDAAHQHERTVWNDDLEANGPRPCDVCLEPVHGDAYRHLNPDGRKFDLDHQTPVAYGGQGPKRPRHARCNRSKGGQLGNLIKAMRSQPKTMKDW
ncbi:MAG TPA: hypothetical protein VGK17_03155 [Propionicimonas sp.]|jgi:hypothetical protein